MKKTNIIKKLINLDLLLDQQTPLFLLLVLVLILRIPNLFEPYWYGDEGIYLTIGQSLNKGAKLYTEIIDHKTPIIYLLARVHTQLNFRLLTIAWMLVTTTAFYYFAKKLLNSYKLAFFSGIIFVLLTTLPWLEGNIPNGELFVLGFVLCGFLLLTKSAYFSDFIEKKGNPKTQKNLLLSSGFLIGLGILTKVPSILDLGAMLSIAFLSWMNLFSVQNLKISLKHLYQLFLNCLFIIIGALIPIVLSIIYYTSIGSAQDYLNFGLLYNFRYAGSWGLPFDSLFLVQSFSLPGKTLYLLAILSLVIIQKKYCKPATQFIIFWFAADLFASLLSNRPYPHYFIQLVPPLALLLTLTAHQIRQLIMKRKYVARNIVPLTLSAIVLALFILVMVLLNFRPYRTSQYYRNWWKLATGNMTKEEYRQSFDSLMEDNYKAAPIITASGTKKLFIWGTNPMLYALTQTQPTGRFTVSFHIKDFNAFDETIQAIRVHKPAFIVVMKNETHEFPEFYNYLIDNYVADNSKFTNFTLWKRTHANNN